MSEHDFIRDIIALIDENIVVDRSPQPIRPSVTVVGSTRLKDRDDDVKQFIRSLKQKHPYARLVVSNKSPVEKAAAMTAVLIGVPLIFIEKAEKGGWDDDAIILDERCVGASTHCVAFDVSARSQSYRKLAERQRKFFSTV